MHRAPLGQLAMDGENLNDHHQSMSQLLQSCTALHAVANNQENAENMVGQLQVRKLNSNGNCINDENRGPDASPMGGGLQGSAKADLVDLSQLAALRKNRAPTMSRRNERERNRVRYLNFTFDVLRQHLPGKGSKGKAKKMSKVDTLRGAIDYIHDLQLLLGDNVEDGASGSQNSAQGSGGEGGPGSSSQGGTESEGDSLSPSGSPHYSGGSPGVGPDQLSDQEEDLGNLAGWFC